MAQSTSARVAAYRRRIKERMEDAEVEVERQRRVIRSILTACAPLLADVDVRALAQREEDARRSLRLGALAPGLLEEMATLVAIPVPEYPELSGRPGGVASAQEAWQRAHTPLKLTAEVVRRLVKPPPVRPRGRPLTAAQRAQFAAAIEAARKE